MSRIIDLSTSQRQVHLDFHTSALIPDVAVEFDAVEFARTFKRAHVNSVTVFAKCHHGQCYYPTSNGTQHPALKGRDLLGEQIEALHREGIRCPIYTTVVWEEDVAQKHPEWRQLTRQGKFVENVIHGSSPYPGQWKLNNFLHPDYQDYIEAHIRELCSRYDVDGFFFDILYIGPNACWSAPSVELREKLGLMGDDTATYERFNSAAQKSFAQKFTKLVHGLVPQATVFYNAGNEGNMDASVCCRSRVSDLTHFEIESLPSGAWGYYHFPRMARMQSHWGKFWLGMTGRFQKIWGDFGGIKPVAALEYECFRSQALGGGNSVGDQLPPRGKLDSAAYTLIGEVYRQVEEAEPFYRNSEALPQVAIYSASYPGLYGGKSEEGAVLMCEESHYDAMVCDSESELDGVELAILPDTTVISPAVKEKLESFYKRGGRLLLSYRSGLDTEGKWALDFLPIKFFGEVEKYPTYWRVRKSFSPSQFGSDRVFYEAGMQVRGGTGTEVLIDRVLPYFKRTDAEFCSHYQTPPVSEKDKFPAAIAGKGFIYFADPIFREYRQTGNMTARDAWREAMHRLIGSAPFGEGLPTTVMIYPRRRGNTLLLTLLHYIPIRKAMDIDIIEERHSFAGEVLKLRTKKGTPRVFGGSALVKSEEGGYVLPSVKGRLLIEVEGYFNG